MNCYIITRPNRTYKLYYDELGALRRTDADPNYDKSFFGWISKNDLYVEANIRAYKSNSIKVELMKVTFEMFWDTYGKKVKIDRAKTQWSKMTEDNQLLAFNGIEKFKKHNGNYGQPALCYPDQYLKDKRWLDEY